MIRAVIWKEIREQGLIGLSLVTLGAGVIVAAATLADPPSSSAPSTDMIRSQGAGLLATLMLAVTAGLVCGGAVFAAEREAGTLSFLDALPVTRARLWRAKLLAGMLLAVVQIILLLGVAAALGLLPSFGWARAITVFAMLAFVWGAFGSTLSQTTLGSVGIAIPAAVLTTFALLFPILLVSRGSGVQSVRNAEAILYLIGMFVLPLCLSAWVFLKPDRLRAADEDASDSVANSKARRSRRGGRALMWLTLRSLRVPGVVLGAFALLLGLSLLPSQIHVLITWPGLALAAGVLSGVTVFADEQTHGTARFWGEQRLPIGRVWVVKVGVHLLFCLGLLLLLMLPLMVRAQFADRASIREHSFLAIVFRTTMLDELSYQGWKYLFVPAAYGFAAGHLCGLLFRKLVVACGVAGVVGGLGAVGWGPSLLAGGVAHWQVWTPPIILLITARLLISAWASDRIATPAILARLCCGVTAAIMVFAASIVWRVLEIPDNPNGEADIAYIEGLPSFDTNRGGASFRTTSERYVRTVAQLPSEFELSGPNGQVSRRVRIDDRFADVLMRGWGAAGDAQLASWLDQAFTTNLEPSSEPWHLAAVEAASHPIGIYEYPQLIGPTGTRDTALQNAYRMATALLVRALQRQAQGDSEAFIPAVRTVLTLARTVRNGSVIAAFQTGRAIEESLLHAIDRWLEAQPPQATSLRAALAPFPISAVAAATSVERPDLFRAIIGILEPADPTEPFDPRPYFLAERYVIREMLKAPSHWLPQVLRLPVDTQDVAYPELDLVTTAWAVPWERERTRRLVGLGYESGLVSSYRFISGRPGVGLLIRPRVPEELVEIERALRGHRRAAMLKLGLRAYHAEHGVYPDPEPPDPLNVLVAKGYLRRVPPDAFDELTSYGYRLASPGGETLRPRPRVVGMRSPHAGENTNVWLVPEGQAILWSTGNYRRGSEHLKGNAPGPEDLIYLVPRGGNP